MSETRRYENLETRTCPFENCEWEYEFLTDDYDSGLSADFASERHYAREHAGEVRVRVVLETKQMLGDRDPQDVAESFMDSYEEDTTSMDVAWTSAEVLEEADDHSEVSE